MNLDPTRIVDTIRTAPTWVGPTIAAAILGFALTAVLIQRRTRTRHTPNRTGSNRGDTWLTTGAALLATGMSAQGMWRVAGDALHIGGPLRVALFAFAEIALLAEARRAAKYFATFGTVGRHGRAVWGIAAGSGAISSMDADTLAGHIVRQLAPLLAAYLWHSGLIANNPPKQRRKSSITWTLNTQRILVALRLAEPGDRTVDEVDRARRLAKLARTAYRLHRLRSTDAWSWRIALVERAVRRQVEQALEHLHLADDPGVRADLRAHLATLYQVVEGTAPDSVADIAPWQPTTPIAIDPVDLDAAEALSGNDAITAGALDLSGLTDDEIWNRIGEPVQPTVRTPVQRIPVHSAPPVQVHPGSVQTLTRTEPNPNPVQTPVRVEPNPNPVQPAATLAEPNPTRTAPVHVRPTIPVHPKPVQARTESNTDLTDAAKRIKPFVNEFMNRNGRIPGQQATRNALAELDPPIRVGLKKAGEIAELAAQIND